MAITSTIPRPFMAEPRHPLLYPTTHLSPIVPSISRSLISKPKIFHAPLATSAADPQPRLPLRLYRRHRSQVPLHQQAQSPKHHQTVSRNYLNLALLRAYSFWLVLLQSTTHANSNVSSAPAENLSPTGVSSSKFPITQYSRIELTKPFSKHVNHHERPYECLALVCRH